jgi:hypothetical protein
MKFKAFDFAFLPVFLNPMRPLHLAILSLSLLAPLFLPHTATADTNPRVVHVFVALADNAHQGIVPVPAKLGRGDDPINNLYWGAAFGVKTYFRSNPDWKLVSTSRPQDQHILERCIFKSRTNKVFLVADAYSGQYIRDAVSDFLKAAAGFNAARASFNDGGADQSIPIAGSADLVAYVGHDAFMDFQIPPIQGIRGARRRPAIVLACASRYYFSNYLAAANADPILWTNGLMAPEAYTLKAALDGWMTNETDEQIRARAAAAYDKYQHCGLHAAQKLFASGW